jgi:hypothetical protein
MLAMLLESTETRCIPFLDADEATGDQTRQPLLRVPKAAVAGSDAERAPVTFMPGEGLRPIRIDGSFDPERKLR